MAILLGLIVTLTLIGLLALLCLPALLRPSPQVERILAVVTSNRPDKRAIGAAERLQAALLALAGKLRSQFGLTANEGVRERLNVAGIRGPQTADLFLAVQFLLSLGAVIGGSFMPTNRMFSITCFAGFAYLAPNFWLSYRLKLRKKKIRRSIPDTVDLLVICVDAGLGLDQALLRVSHDLELGHPEVFQEITLVQLEQRAGVARLEAWQNLARRTKIEEFAAFVSMLVQTDRFGTPIAKALSGFADDLRLRRRQHAEEAAAKTKIKIVIPLVLCIFPFLFIVLLAPAAIAMIDGLSKMGN